MYIAIEGIDTAGKSTQVELLVKNLQQFSSNVIVTKEPGATAIGSKIREMVLFDDVKSSTAELLLFLADRAEHITEVITPNLDKNIVSDRSLISGIAYAKMSGNYSLQELINYNIFATNNTLPDIVFILKLTKEELHNRLSKKVKDSIESRGEEYLLKIQENLIQASLALQIKTVEIDATQSIETIANEISIMIEKYNDEKGKQ